MFLAYLKSWTTWVIVGLVVVLLLCGMQLKLATKEIDKQRARARAWEATAKQNAEAAARARDLVAKKDKIRKEHDERAAQIKADLDARRAEAAKTQAEVREEVTKQESAAGAAKRLREEINEDSELEQ